MPCSRQRAYFSKVYLNCYDENYDKHYIKTLVTKYAGVLQSSNNYYIALEHSIDCKPVFQLAVSLPGSINHRLKRQNLSINHGLDLSVFDSEQNPPHTRVSICLFVR